MPEVYEPWVATQSCTWNIRRSGNQRGQETAQRCNSWKSFKSTDSELDRSDLFKKAAQRRFLHGNGPEPVQTFQNGLKHVTITREFLRPPGKSAKKV